MNWLASVLPHDMNSQSGDNGTRKGVIFFCKTIELFSKCPDRDNQNAILSLIGNISCRSENHQEGRLFHLLCIQVVLQLQKMTDTFLDKFFSA